MADFYTPVRMPRPAFEQLIARVDKAVGEHSVALVLSEDFAFRALDPIEPTAIDFRDIDIEKPLEIVNYLDQLLYFAFEFAPEEVISSWADEYDSQLKGEAIERVTYIRDNMPQLSKLWNSKSDSIIAPMISFSYETTLLRDSSMRCVNLYLSAGRIRDNGAPDKTDLVRMRVQLWPSDVRLLIRELQHLWGDHLNDSADEEEGGGVDDEANNAQS
jgi:hypothetical protein